MSHSSATGFSSCRVLLFTLFFALLAMPSLAQKVTDDGKGDSSQSGSHQGAVAIDFTDGKQPIEQLLAGGDFYVEASGLPALEPVEMALIDDAGQLVTRVLTRTDAQGDLSSTPLWWKTGVVGCGRCAGADPTKYRFQRVEEALSVLAGRTFSVHLSTSAATLGGMKSVMFAPDAASPVFEFSDGACNQSDLTEGDTLYLSATALDGTQTTWTVFLISASVSPSIGDALVDVRGDAPLYPQQIDVEAGQTSFVEPIWVDTAPGTYGAVLRQGTSTTAVFQAGDRWLGFQGTGNQRGPHGITIKSHQCPDCDDPVTGGGTCNAS